MGEGGGREGGRRKMAYFYNQVSVSKQKKIRVFLSSILPFPYNSSPGVRNFFFLSILSF